MERAQNFTLNYLILTVNKIYTELFLNKNEQHTSKEIPLLLFRSMLNKMHTLKILVDSRDPLVEESAYSITRSVLECQWNILYIIKEDCEFRTKAYEYFSKMEAAKSRIKEINFQRDLQEMLSDQIEEVVDSLTTNILKYRKALQNNQEDFVRYFQDIYGENAEYEMRLKHEEGIKANLQAMGKCKELDLEKQFYDEEVQHLRLDPKYSHIRHEITLAKRHMRYPKWYSLKSLHKPYRNNLKVLTSYLGKDFSAQYVGLYSSLSQESHVLNATKQLTYQDGKAVFRNVENSSIDLMAQDAFDQAMYSLFEVWPKILKHYNKDHETSILFEGLRIISEEKYEHL